MAKLTKEIIIAAAKAKGIDPYTQPFKPKDLGINPGVYGSFSDYCSRGETTSGKWAKATLLRVASHCKGKWHKPYNYYLLQCV